MFRTTKLKKYIYMSWIVNFVLMKLMKILLEMYFSSPSLVSPPDGWLLLG